MAIIDLKSYPFQRKIFSKILWGYTDVCRTIDFQAGYGLNATTNLSSLRVQIQGRFQSKNILMSRSVSMHGFRPDYSSGKSARYRDLSPISKQEAVPYGHPRTSFKVDSSRCQRKARLAHIRRIRTKPYWYSQRIIPRRLVSRRPGRNNICFGRNHDRSLLVSFPMGGFSKKESRCQTPHLAGSKGKHSYFYPYFRRQVARCQRSRSFATGSRCILRNGSRLPRFRKAPRLQSGPCFFRDPCQSQYAIQATLLSASRQRNWASMRSNDHAYWFLHEQTLPRHSAPSEILRCRYRKDTCFSYQQFHFASINDNSVVSQPVAGRVVFQMDQATSQDKEILWNLRKCREDSSLDSGLCLSPRCHNEKAAQPPRKSLHYFTNFERFSFRKDSILSTGYRKRLQDPRSPCM